MTYRVIWEIDIEAGSARQAAQRALEIQRNPESIATVFAVCNAAGNAETVDLEEEEDKG